MKKKYITKKNFFPNLFTIRQSHLNLVVKSIILVLFTFCTTSITAQVTKSNDKTPQVLEVKSFIAAMKAAEQNSRATYSQAKYLENLLSDVQQTIYFDSGQVKSYGEKPSSLITNTNSLNGILTSAINSGDIEIVTIKISNNVDLATPIDLSVFSNFSKLNYIYIVSNVSTTDISILKLIKNINPRYHVFYKIDKSE
ncbi:hypothetical protein SAMN05444395_109124 [Flavobacterium fryxellicola]|uniref:hypothetical protein n=1 Tax=Flavobacterium fryxellicola TaxID=249352 RepID=UPI00091138EB|nr:hypothetical protein [Flavobacterium fryxellicola]SHN75574.1 hypothetical protein SAMN05444395_109124 [Flavobacterium fryxellicola]